MADYKKLGADLVSDLVRNAAVQLQENGDLPAGDLPNYALEVPADVANGDYSCNIAMAGARVFRKAPVMTANLIKDAIEIEGTYIDRVEVAGPGFMNFYLKQNWFADVVANVLEEKENYGRSDVHKGEKIMVEFVSANPTGPMHMGNARGGGLGDALAECMAWTGYDVTKEFYVNDAGNQILKFGGSLSARYMQHFLGEEAVPFPEDGYHGADIKERAEEFIAIHGDKYVEASEEDRAAALVEFALPKNVDKLRADLEKYNIFYDVWFKESVLHNNGTIQKILDVLAEKGATYEQDGALWYRATEFGGEKDEVLIRQNGTPTYFAADIAYHYNKFAERGFDKVVNVWGADHHGHVARLKGAMDAIGLSGDALDVVLMQLVRLVKDGAPVRMSKRTGKVITLADLLDEVPLDAARFFFNLREPSSQMDFDLDLAVEETSQNPVYYVQYAHARICSIFKNLQADGTVSLADLTNEDLQLLVSAEERSLIRHLASFPGTIKDAVDKYDPAQVTHYVLTLAGEFHKFYNACRIKGEEKHLATARLALCEATGTAIRNALSILKVSAPEHM